MSVMKSHSLLRFAPLCLWALLIGCDRSVVPNPSSEQTEEQVTPKPHPPQFEFNNQPEQRSSAPPVENTVVGSKPIQFTNVAEQVGLDFVYENGAYGQELMVESLGGGCCWLDYDGDGWPDLFLPQGGKPDAENPSERPPDVLFRNHLGTQFDKVSAAGVEGLGYSQGAASGDFDGDGFDDLYVTNVGKNILYRNLGDGTFEEITDFAGVGDSRWSSSAAWSDLNGDGLLDLYVCNYGDYDPYSPQECLKDGVPALCHPRNISPVPDECYLNLGDGRFDPSAQRLGLYGDGNRGLGVVAADLDNNGSTDLYVCNDTTANFLFLQQSEGHFEEVALMCGAALNAQGYAQASMGVAVGDYDGNLALDLYLTHFTNEENALYQNLGDRGRFREVAGLTGMRPISYSKLGFGTVMYDFNGDGSMDLFVANGHIDSQHADADGYEQYPQMISFRGDRWIEFSQSAGDYFQKKRVGRGVAAADYDRDGDLDLAVVHQNSPLALLRNEADPSFLSSFRFRGLQSARHGINVRMWLECGERLSMYELVGGTSYCATHFPELIVPNYGVSQSSVRIRWPSGQEFEYNVVPTKQPILFFEDGNYKFQSAMHVE